MFLWFWSRESTWGILHFFKSKKVLLLSIKKSNHKAYGQDNKHLVEETMLEGTVQSNLKTQKTLNVFVQTQKKTYVNKEGMHLCPQLTTKSRCSQSVFSV